jgi:hypothetical protein
MAHFAKLDESNVVTEVIVVSNVELNDLPFPESEPIGVQFCKLLYGPLTNWKQTSYNGSFRKQFAGIGFTYTAAGDVFVSPKPARFPSWILDQNYDWVPPIPRPTDGVYSWNESTVSWDVVPQPYPSWKAEGNPLQWVPPVLMPLDGNIYIWDEATLSWVPYTQEIPPEQAP